MRALLRVVCPARGHVCTDLYGRICVYGSNAISVVSNLPRDVLSENSLATFQLRYEFQLSLRLD